MSTHYHKLYVAILAIKLVVWPERHESLNMIALGSCLSVNMMQPSKLWRWNTKKSTPSDVESMPLPNPMVGFNLPNGKSAFDPNSVKTSLMICNRPNKC